MAENSNRMQRVESLIQTELANLIQFAYHERNNLSFSMITITGVKVSNDLSYAKIYVVTHDDDQSKAVIQFLKQEAKALRYQLAHRIKIRKMPELHFYYDESIARGERISKLLGE